MLQVQRELQQLQSLMELSRSGEPKLENLVVLCREPFGSTQGRDLGQTVTPPTGSDILDVEEEITSLKARVNTLEAKGSSVH